mgnify:CR=1 FL=1
MVVVIVSTFVARDLELALFEVVLVLQMYLVFLYLASTTRTVEDVRFIAAALVLGLAVSGALMVNQRFSGWPGPHALFAIADNQTLAEESRDRVIGTMGSPNTAAAYLTLLLAPTACVWLTSSSRRFKLLAAVAFASGLLALLLSQSRGGLLALGISMGIVALVSLRRGWLPAKAPLIAICAVAILVAILPEGFFKRLAQDDSGSAQARWPLMLLALRMIADQSLLGVGANNFSTVMMQYVTPDFSAYGGEWLYTVHNKYLLVWAQTGLGGLITFIAVLIVALINGWREIGRAHV